MITWDQTKLPLPTSLRVDHRTSTLRKRTESGRFQIRKRYSTDYEQGTVSFQFIGNQFQLFKGVWLYYLNNGADWFFIDLPVGGDQTLVQCKVRFISDYSYTYVNVDNATVRAEIEFFRVEEPSELTLQNLTTIGTPTPYQEQNLHLWFAQAEVPDTTLAQFTINADSGFYAVQWWDGSITTHASTTAANKAMPTGAVVGFEYKVLAWACASLTDTTPSGNITSITANNNLISRVNTKELAEINNLTFSDADNLKGEFGNEVATFPFKQDAQNYTLTRSEKIQSIVLDGFSVNSSLDAVSITNCTELTSFAVNSVDDGNIQMNSLTIGGCNLSGTLDLSNVIFDKAVSTGNRYILAYANNLTQVTINKLVHNTSSFNCLGLVDNNLIAIVVLDEIVAKAGTNSNLRSNQLNVNAIYNLIDKMSVSGTGNHNIYLNNNPCWVDGALDANDPQTTATLSLAASKNITFSQ